MYVVPQAIEHYPIADPDTHSMIIEPTNTANMGQLENESAVAIVDQHWTYHSSASVF